MQCSACLDSAPEQGWPQCGTTDHKAGTIATQHFLDQNTKNYYYYLHVLHSMQSLEMEKNGLKGRQWLPLTMGAAEI